MRVRTLSSLALGRVPSEQWNALDAQVQRCLFPAELRRALGRFQRFILTRRSERRAFFSRAQTEQDNECMTVRSENTVDVMTKGQKGKILNGDHLVVVRGGCTCHGIAARSATTDEIRVVDVDDKDSACKLRVVDLDTFLGSQSTFGVVRYQSTKEHRVDHRVHYEDSNYEDALFHVFGTFLRWTRRRDRTVELAIAMTKMRPDDLREYDVIRQDPQCFAWACCTGHFTGVASEELQRILDVSTFVIHEGLI